MTGADLERISQKEMTVPKVIVVMISPKRIEMDPTTNLGRAIDQGQILGQILDIRLETTLSLNVTIPDRIAGHQNMTRIIGQGMTNMEGHQTGMENMTVRTRTRATKRRRTSIAPKTIGEARLIINPIDLRVIGTTLKTDLIVDIATGISPRTAQIAGPKDSLVISPETTQEVSPETNHGTEIDHLKHTIPWK